MESKIQQKKTFKYRLLAEGAVIGLITGALISLFRLMLTAADRLRDMLVAYAGGGAGHAAICALILIAAAAAVTVLLVREPDIAGSGLPRGEAEVRGEQGGDGRPGSG